MSRKFSELIFGVENVKNNQVGGAKKKKSKSLKRKKSKNKNKNKKSVKTAKGNNSLNRNRKRRRSNKYVNHIRFGTKNLNQVSLERGEYSY